MPSIISVSFTLIIEDIQVWGFSVLFVLESILFQSQMCIYHLYKEEGQGRTIWGLSLVFQVQKGRNRTERHRHTNTQYGEWRRKHWEKGALEGKRPAGHSVLGLKLVKISPCFYPPLAITCFMVLINFNYAIFHSIYFLTYHIICLCYIHIYISIYSIQYF